MKKNLFTFSLVLLISLSLKAAPAPTHIHVERFDGGYHIEVYGRLKDTTQVERFDVNDAISITKISGIDISPEFALTKSPIQFWIHFADGANPDKAEGSISQIDFHIIDTFIFSTKTIIPIAQSSKDVVADIQAVIDSKTK